MKYRVVVSVMTVETWEVEDVENEAEACEQWEEGHLLSTGGYKMDEILSVTEVPTSISLTRAKGL